MTARYIPNGGAQFLITAGHGVLYLLDALQETVKPVSDQAGLGNGLEVGEGGEKNWGKGGRAGKMGEQRGGFGAKGNRQRNSARSVFGKCRCKAHKHGRPNPWISAPGSQLTDWCYA